MDTTLDTFKNDFLSYYLALEQRVIDVSKYIEFDKKNYTVFSKELLSILQAIGSEVDVCGKSIAEYFYPQDKELDEAPIAKWGYFLQKGLPNVAKASTSTVFDRQIKPWLNWADEPGTNKIGKTIYKLQKGSNNPEWWRAYNKIKHRRKSLIHPEQSSYDRANLKNVIHALAGLYTLESLFMGCLSDESSGLQDIESSLFTEIKIID